METITLKPVRSKIIVFWLTMSGIVLIISLLVEPNLLSNLLAAVIGLIYLLGACLVFNLVFFNLPYFRVEITETHYIGPDFPGLAGWQRAEIPVEVIDLERPFTGLSWLGYYVIKTKGSGMIALWGFDENQYSRFKNIILARLKMPRTATPVELSAEDGF